LSALAGSNAIAVAAAAAAVAKNVRLSLTTSSPAPEAGFVVIAEGRAGASGRTSGDGSMSARRAARVFLV
jgi:hypothetical protein